MTVEAWGPTPLRPAMNGRLLLLIIPLRFAFVNGTPPVSGKISLLGLEKGRPLIWVSVMIPVTTLADGCVPPKMSCMKKVNVGVSDPAGFATMAPDVAVTGAVGTTAAVVVGPATGAIPIIGVDVVSGSSGSGCGATSISGTSDSGSGGSMSSAIGVAGTWSLGSVVVGPTCGVTFGTVVVAGLANWGGSGRTGGIGSTSSRTLAELAHPKVMSRSKRQMLALNVAVVGRESFT
ncbi:hypothetical protein F2P56_017074, partial [Juglans regia]